MKVIYINGYFLTQPITGVQRFAFNILKELDNYLEKNLNQLVIKCILPSKINYKFKFIQLKVYPLWLKGLTCNHILWEQLALPLAVKKGFLLNLCNFAPLLKKKQLVVIHDVIPFRYPKTCSKAWGTLFRIMVKLFVRRTKYLASVSNFSAQEICLVTQVTREIIVLGNSGEHFKLIKPDTSILTKLNLTAKKYILTISSQAHISYKNLSILPQIASQVNYPIIAIGKGISNNLIKYTGRLTDNEVKALYSNALVLIFPSFYEGFGIPPLEAMMCSTPVIVSDIPVFKEIYEQAAIYFNPHNANDLLNKINYLLGNPNLYLKLVNNGYDKALSYSWKNIASKIIQTVQQEC